MDMLTLAHVKKHFGERQILKDVSFAVPEHSVFGFVGQNGAGKTTTMKLILGLMEADEGSILVHGERVSFGNTATNRYIGYLPDVPEFYSYMKPAEYLRFCGEISGIPSSQLKKRIDDMLCLVGLDGADKQIRGFSRGMKQRLGVAQALLHQPKLLICDEPTSALDPVGRRELLDILCAAKEQTTVLFSTHILSDVEKICDEIAFLHEGTILLQGALTDICTLHGEGGYTIELKDEAAVNRLLAGRLKMRREGQLKLHVDDAHMPYVLSYLSDNRIGFERIERAEVTLEDLFMEVIGR